MNERIVSTKIHVYNLDELSELEKKLILVAKESTEKAYAPYSNFQVGAALLLDNGAIITGNNQENAAYPSGLCAERVALFYANAQHPDIPVVMMAIAAQTKGEFTENCTSPCGSCRQVILESEQRYKQPIRILMYGRKEIFVVNSITELMPLYFGQTNLTNL